MSKAEKVKRAAGRRQVEAPLDLHIALKEISRISRTSKGLQGNDLVPYLIQHNLMGALWSPVHLSAVFCHLSEESQGLQWGPGSESLFEMTCRNLLADYKFMSFEEMTFNHTDLIASLNLKIARAFGVGFLEKVKAFGVVPTQSHMEFMQREWNYLKATVGTEIEEFSDLQAAQST